MYANTVVVNLYVSRQIARRRLSPELITNQHVRRTVDGTPTRS